jgi:hypothetical protein
MMTHEQRAVQIWSVLVLAARNQQILSYQLLESITGVPKFTVAPILGKVESYCDNHKLPKLTALVVNQKQGVLGYLFPGYLGTPVHLDHPEHKETSEDPNTTVYMDLFKMDLFKEQSRVFVFDWLTHGAPSDADFEDTGATVKQHLAHCQISKDPLPEAG